MTEIQGKTFHFIFLKIHGTHGQNARQARTFMYSRNINTADGKKKMKAEICGTGMEHEHRQASPPEN